MGGTTGTGMTGRGLGSTTGHHDHHAGEDIVHGGAHYTETANKLDPHVSGGSGLESSTTTGTSGLSMGSSGTTTSGPHSSSLANKADPR